MVLYIVSLKYAHAIGPVTKNMVIHEAEKCSAMYDAAAEWLGLDISKFKLVCVHNFDSPVDVKLNYFHLSPALCLSDYIPAAEGNPNVMAIIVPKPDDTEEVADNASITPLFDPTGKRVSRVRAAKKYVARALFRMWPDRAAHIKHKLAARGYGRV
ncbi:hypothetical protein LPJ60_001243 [Coemansia sp. RSA 2675]|nr:hypothetical protein LPJ60_001243 [Coemansia sp. RSA 2675]